MAGRRTVAKAKPITRNQVRGYDYVPNPGVRALVAVNGRGAYRSARSAMSGLSANERRQQARKLTRAERQVFAKKIAAKEKKPMKRNAARVRTALAGRRRMRSNKSPSAAQLRARANFARMARARAAAARSGKSPARRTAKRRPMRRNTSVAVPASGWDRIYGKKAQARRAKASTGKRKLTKAERAEISRKNLAKARAARKAKSTRRAALKSKAGRSALRKSLQYGGMSARATGRKYKKHAHGRKLTKAERKAIAIKNLQKAWAKRRAGKGSTVKLAANRRRKASSKRRTTGRRRQTAAQRRASLKNIKRAQAALRRNGRRRTVSRRRTTKRRMTSNRRIRRNPTRRTRKTTKRRTTGKRRQTAAQRRASLKNIKRAQAALRRKGGKRRRLTSNRKRRLTSRSRRLRRNSRRSYRRNSMTEMFKVAGAIAGGLMAHKALMAIVDAIIIRPLFTPAPLPEAPAATAGLPANAEPIVSNLASIGLAAAGILATKSLVKDRELANSICGGIVASAAHKVVVTVLSQLAPASAGYLSGMDDSTAARLSAMYGFGATSIQPMYNPITGYGEYMQSPVGEFFESSLQGPLSEYFESGTEGLGNYSGNPDLMQAAAGYGSVAFGEENTSNHILPTSDLDQQLNIAEAAAGVGMSYEAAAGYGASPYEAAAGYGGGYGEYLQGMGAVTSVPSASTWVPGEANGQLWAGVRPVARTQQSTAMVPGGILETRGGAGIFG